MATASFLPLPSKEILVKEFVGKSIKDVATPAAVLDLQKLKNNCSRMLDAVESLNCGWRAHIKTHKTTELTRLQVGDGPGPVNLIVSTIAEAENVLPLLLEYKSAGRVVNLLYGFPVTPSAVPRLTPIAAALGPHALTLLIDHPAQLLSVSSVQTPTSIFIKIDMGGNRAGVIPNTESCSQLISSVLALEATGKASLLGLYAHAGQSYAGDSQSAALDFLRQEFEALLLTSATLHSTTTSTGAHRTHPLVLSVGATPTTTSIRALLLSTTSLPPSAAQEVSALKATMRAIRDSGFLIEIHAGVYPVLDIQQLSTRALPSSQLSWADMALTIVAEIASLYPGRGARGSTEALLGAGTLALGREPCKAYPGWGILTPWNREDAGGGAEGYKGWIVGRTSQEHGVLTWGGEVGDEDVLVVGQKVRVWPNHACIAGVGFGWYLVVDGGDEIVDVWVRWRGW
ncbi:D-serine dehydratase [Lachnellula occidentalis]|uniref:D-serine dehydratase n=1 Tax=Lachnellula occidentalis TaxID=215460 RepID=A0A8H8RR17_9HELO|nr:D-serine dehydratase [Lachnellula occidentalis]